jgi:multidrug transporter EmrE-like cation transporter
MRWRRVTGLSASAVVGLGCAGLSAFGTNLAFLYKHRGAVAAPDVDMRHALRSAADLFRSKWWAIGWLVAVAAFLAHVGALSLLPLSTAQAVLSGGFVLLAVLAERFFGFQLGRRQWIGIILVAVSLGLLGVTGKQSGGDTSDYSLTALILFEGCGIAVGLLLIFSHRIERARAQYGVLLGAAAGLGFGISDVAIKALTDDLESGIVGLLSPWSALVVIAAVGSFFASARSLQVGDGVAVIAVTSVAANMSAIVAGMVVFGDPLGDDFLVVAARLSAFLLVLLAAALMPAPVRVGEALKTPGGEGLGTSPKLA